jgi:Mrp family chromosome partitioning ATPase
MGECNHNCSECADRASGKCGGSNSLKAPANAKSDVRKVVAVMSGKGGVGKSLVTELLAVGAAQRGLKTAVLDADITGPSIPTAFGVAERVTSDGENMIPCRTMSGIAVMSLNLLVENPADPVVWRGPVIAGAVKQFWSDVAWGDVDVMFVDMPPGTGDVPLTVLQSLPVAGVVIVTSPQDLVSLIVEKAVRMADMMKVPILGLVENMSEFKCPDCGKVHRIFGDGKAKKIAAAHGIKAVASIPIDAQYAKAVDEGLVERVDPSPLKAVLDAIV